MWELRGPSRYVFPFAFFCCVVGRSPPCPSGAFQALVRLNPDFIVFKHFPGSFSQFFFSGSPSRRGKNRGE